MKPQLTMLPSLPPHTHSAQSHEYFAEAHTSPNMAIFGSSLSNDAACQGRVIPPYVPHVPMYAPDLKHMSPVTSDLARVHAEIALLEAQTAYMKAYSELQSKLRAVQVTPSPAEPSTSPSTTVGTGYFQPRTPTTCNDNNTDDSTDCSLSPAMQCESGTGVFLRHREEAPHKAGSTVSDQDAVWLNLEDVAYSSVHAALPPEWEY